MFLLVSSFLYAQQENDDNDSTQTVVIPYAVDYQYEFPNINRINFFYDKKKWKKIKKAQKKGDWQKELILIRNYVQHFGIENFYKQTNLIWKWGQLEEKAGNIHEAKAIYRLALHNHPLNVKELKSHYDELTEFDKPNYVSLEKYYEMVEVRKKVDTLVPPRNVYTNMGKKINSKHADYGPSINLNTNELIFTSKRNVSALGKVNEDIYHSFLKDGQWSSAEPIGLPINSGDNDGSPCLSNDGKYLFFARCNCVRCEGCDIFYVERQEDGAWGKIKSLGDYVNSPYWDSHPSLSKTGDTLYFSSDRPGGFGGPDIYYTYKNPDGSWAKAQNMGPVINTKNAEVSPFYHPLYDVLYFSSNADGRYTNFGGFDIYRSHFFHDKWREPRNVGPLVNGPGDEYYFTIDAESKKLYYAKAEADNKDNLDLYSYPLPMGANPLATTKLEGEVTDEFENPYKGIMHIIDLDNGIEIAPTHIRTDGSYEFSLIDNNNYLLIIHGEDFFRLEKQFHLQGDTRMDIQIPRINVKRFVFENIDFETNSWEITPNMTDDLSKVLDFMLDNPFYSLKIAGHTDSDGREEDNIKLSQNRANAIKEWLIEQSYAQIGAERIEAVGFGSSKPLVNEDTPENKAINRRVEFEILEQSTSDEENRLWEE